MARKRKREHDKARFEEWESSKKVKFTSQSRHTGHPLIAGDTKKKPSVSSQISRQSEKFIPSVRKSQEPADAGDRETNPIQTENLEPPTKKRNRSRKHTSKRGSQTSASAVPNHVGGAQAELGQNSTSLKVQKEISKSGEAIPDATISQKPASVSAQLLTGDDEDAQQIATAEKRRKREENQRKSLQNRPRQVELLSTAHALSHKSSQPDAVAESHPSALCGRVQILDRVSALEMEVGRRTEQDKGKSSNATKSDSVEVTVDAKEQLSTPVPRIEATIKVAHSQSQGNGRQHASAKNTLELDTKDKASDSKVFPHLPSSKGASHTYKSSTRTVAEQLLSKQLKQETRFAKRERRLQKRTLRDINEAQVTHNENEAGSTELGKRTTKSKRGEKRPRDSTPWSMSDMLGGYILDIDPLFSDNEKSVLIAFNTAIHVYATDTSLLCQRLRLRDERDTVSGFAFSAKGLEHLYVGTRSGFIDVWDWAEGRRLGSWNTQSSIRALATARASDTSSKNSLLYTSDETFGGDNPYTITAHRLFGGDEANKTDLKTLWRSDKPAQFLRVLEEGKNIVATSGSTLLLGTTTDPEPSNLAELVYTWHQISCSEHITSVDIRVRGAMTDLNIQRKKVKKPHPSLLDITIGTLGGFIFIYRDIFSQVAAQDSNPSSSLDDPQRIHWHRNAVSSVKWSKDGNYLISGGQETVLVIHQLTTGRLQFLPNLMAPIRSVVVSPMGTSYAVNLAENSAMIISTTELKPTFSVAGLRLTQPRSAGYEAPFVSTVENPYPASQTLSRVQFPTTIHPLHHSQLLVAVPSSTEPTASQSATYLQTIDLSSASALTAQALTRTIATTKNITPDATSITTPDVTHLSISSDGKWLATVDEWAPPLKDLEPVAFDREQALQDQASRKEIYLKIWSQSSDSSEWELSTRIDNPHSSDHTPPPSILALASDPSIDEFVSLASDGYLHFWSPSKRIRNGLPVQDESRNVLMNWKCTNTTYLDTPNASPDEKKVPQAGYIAYSLDGSVCVAGYRIAAPQEVFIVNTVSGEIATTIVSTFPSPLLLDLCMLSRSLVLYHPGELEIHDLVDNSVSIIPLPKMAKCKDPRKALNGARLAVDAEANSIAVGFHDRPRGGNDAGSSKGRVQIYDLGSQHFVTPVFEKTFYHGIAELLCSHPPVRHADQKAPDNDLSLSTRRKEKHGFVIIDRAAQIYTLVPPLTASHIIKASSDLIPQQVPTPPPSDAASQDVNGLSASPGPLANLFTKPSQESSSTSKQTLLRAANDSNDHNADEQESSLEALLNNANDAIPAPEYPVVSAERLAEVFDNAAVGGNGFLPPVDVLYREVLGLFIGRNQGT